MARGRSRRSGESNAFHSDRAAHSLPVAARLWRWSATITGRKDRQSSAITGGEHLVIISHHQQSADHHQLSSVSHHQHSSPVISRHQRSGISVTCEEPHVKQASIRCNQVQPGATRCNQMQSEAIRSNQMQSEAISPASSITSSSGAAAIHVARAHASRAPPRQAAVASSRARESAAAPATAPAAAEGARSSWSHAPATFMPTPTSLQARRAAEGREE